MTKQVEMIRVTEVEPLGGFVLRLRFNDDTERVVDLEDELWGPVFEPLKEDPELFRAVRLEGESIAWPNEADLAPEFLHSAGRLVAPSR
ncbi:MAG TPA: DUF2442 domain-containing protein [Solirubrobacterales bacterium]|jgi:hypothetical protein